MKIRVTKDEIKIEENSKIHKGEYNATKLEFIFSEEYDGLTKKAIFEADKDKLEVSIVNDECYIPATILSGKANKFNLRVYATENNGDKVIKRYSPTYISIPLYNGSYIGNTTPVPSGDVNLQNKSITITENGVQTITADTGYDGLESVEIETNVPSSGGSLDLSNGIKFAYSNFNSIPNDILNANWEDITEMDNMFQYSAISSVPTIGTTSIVSMQYTFSNCPNLITVNNNNTENVIHMAGIFENDSNLQYVPELDTSSCINMQTAFQGCSSLTNTSLDNILAMCANVNASYMRPKALKDIGLDDTQIATCQTLSNYQDAVDAGWTDNIEVTVDVDLTIIRSLAGTSNPYTVPTLGALDMYLYNYNVICTLNDSVIPEQVVGTINWNHFESSDSTLSFDINYNDTGSGNEYYFESITYTPNA